jgi:hypothetical protein
MFSTGESTVRPEPLRVTAYRMNHALVLLYFRTGGFRNAPWSLPGVLQCAHSFRMVENGECGNLSLRPSHLPTSLKRLRRKERATTTNAIETGDPGLGDCAKPTQM